MDRIKFRYTYRRKSDGHIYQVIYPLECIEDVNGQFASIRDNKLWEVIGRDLCSGVMDVDNSDIFNGDIIDTGDKVLQVIFQDGCFYTPYTDNEGIKSRHRLGGWKKSVLQIVGDIYTSPELLTPTNKQ